VDSTTSETNDLLLRFLSHPLRGNLKATPTANLFGL
jgi:hypothetical protein